MARPRKPAAEAAGPMPDSPTLMHRLLHIAAAWLGTTGLGASLLVAASGATDEAPVSIQGAFIVLALTLASLVAWVVKRLFDELDRRGKEIAELRAELAEHRHRKES